MTLKPKQLMVKSIYSSLWTPRRSAEHSRTEVMCFSLNQRVYFLQNSSIPTSTRSEEWEREEKIVQAYPAVEYWFTPERIAVTTDDLVCFVSVVWWEHFFKKSKFPQRICAGICKYRIAKSWHRFSRFDMLINSLFLIINLSIN